MKCPTCGHDREKDLSDLSQLLALIRDLRAGLSDPQVPSERVENPDEPLQSQISLEEESIRSVIGFGNGFEMYSYY